MNFEDLQIIWDDEGLSPSYTVDEVALHRIVAKKAHSFRRTIFWRDFREIAVAIPIFALFLGRGIQSALGDGGPFSLLSISLFLQAFGVAFVGVFLFVSHRHQKRREENFEESIQGNLRKHISNVAYQIRLLSKVFWWYLFPLIPGVILFVAATSESGRINFWIRSLIIFLIFVFVFWLNMRAVSKHLIPQKRELESFLSRLEKNGE